MSKPESTEISTDGKEAIENFMNLLKQTIRWNNLLGHEDFYYCDDPQVEYYQASLREKLVSSIHSTVNLTNGSYTGYTCRQRHSVQNRRL